MIVTLPLIEHLVQKFGDRPVEKCITKSNDIYFKVVEDEDNLPCKIWSPASNEESIIGFEIENPNCQSIFLFALDHCFFTPRDPAHCDFAVFDHLLHLFCGVKTQCRTI